MKHDHNRLFLFGLKEKSLVHVDSVKNGLSCDCICPNCKEPLVAYNNSTNKRTKHFQHKSKKECIGYYETVLHYLAKEVIESRGYLIVPDVNFMLSECAENYRRDLDNYTINSIGATKLIFDKIEIEESQGSFKPDLTGVIQGKTCYIEIAVTHFVDENKLLKVKRLGFPLLEIDLSNHERITTKETLADALDDIGIMKLLYNKKIEERQRIKNLSAQSITIFVEKNIKRLKAYGRNKMIYHCPLTKVNGEVVRVEDDCKRCLCFAGSLDATYRMGDQPDYPENFVECIGHVKDDFKNILKANNIQSKDYEAYLKENQIYGQLR
jgi:hypothetical protein